MLEQVVRLYEHLLTTDRADAAELADIRRKISVWGLDKFTLSMCKHWAQERVNATARINAQMSQVQC